MNKVHKFTSDLIVKSYSNSHWKTTQEFYFYFNESDKSKGITVSKNFVTDFASVPRILWSILPPTGKHTKAALLHDFLYSKKGSHNLDRKQCDKIFLDAMLILGVTKWRRIAMYWGVRIFGKKFYKNDRYNRA